MDVQCSAPSLLHYLSLAQPRAHTHLLLVTVRVKLEEGGEGRGRREKRVSEGGEKDNM